MRQRRYRSGPRRAWSESLLEDRSVMGRLVNPNDKLAERGPGAHLLNPG